MDSQYCFLSHQIQCISHGQTIYLKPMKTCSYCGKQYPDEIVVCPVDGKTLPGALGERKKVTGVWRGVYGYVQREPSAALKPVAFTLKLKQGWLAHFDGSVTEDAPSEILGTVDGYFSSPKIEFTKQMPVGHILGAEGNRMTLRDYAIAAGHPCAHEPPAPPIFYQGTFLDANRVQGTWTINAHQIAAADGSRVSLPGGAGFWCAEFVTADAKDNPTGGPTAPLFDKNRLSPAELETVEGVAYVSLGNFNVADAENIIQLLIRDNIRINVKRDDDAMSQMMPIQEMTGGYAGTAQMVEIFVHPEDEADARQLLHPEDPV